MARKKDIGGRKDIARDKPIIDRLIDLMRTSGSTKVLSIGEVAERYGPQGVTFDKLRYLDRIGLLVPERTGVGRAYTPNHLARLDCILDLLVNHGWGYVGLKAVVLREVGQLSKPSVSETLPLHEQLRSARPGDIIRVRLPSKRDYNTGYQRIARICKKLGFTVGIGKQVEIRLSEDEQYLEVRFRK